MAGLVHFAARTGSQVIAEGIETEAERAMVAELGVTLGQGYLLARPASVETVGGGPETATARRGSTEDGEPDQASDVGSSRYWTVRVPIIPSAAWLSMVHQYA